MCTYMCVCVLNITQIGEQAVPGDPLKKVSAGGGKV